MNITIDAIRTRSQFVSTVSQFTGYAPGTVSVLTKIDRNRDSFGRYLPGTRYVFVAGKAKAIAKRS